MTNSELGDPVKPTFLGVPYTPPGQQESEGVEVEGIPTILGHTARVPDPEPIGFLEAMKLDSGYLPVVGTVNELEELNKVYRAAQRVSEGRGTDKDGMILDAYMREESRGYTFMGGIGNILKHVPAFIAELAISGGVISGGKFASKEAAKAIIKHGVKETARKRAAASSMLAATKHLVKKAGEKKLTKAAMWTLGVGARVGVLESLGHGVGFAKGNDFTGGRVSHRAMQMALGNADWTVDDLNRFELAIDAHIPQLVEKLPQAFLAEAIEIGTELIGGHITSKAGKFLDARGIKELPIHTQMRNLEMAVARRVLGTNAVRGTKELTELMGKYGWNGVMTEFLEERLAGAGGILAAQIPGFEEDFDGAWDDLLPGPRRAAQEFLAFSVPGAAAIGLNASVDHHKKKVLERSGALRQFEYKQEGMSEAEEISLLANQSGHGPLYVAGGVRALNAFDIKKATEELHREAGKLRSPAEKQESSRERALFSGQASQDPSQVWLDNYGQRGIGMRGSILPQLEERGLDPTLVIGRQMLLDQLIEMNREFTGNNDLVFDIGPQEAQENGELGVDDIRIAKKFDPKRGIITLSSALDFPAAAGGVGLNGLYTMAGRNYGPGARTVPSQAQIFGQLIGEEFHSREEMSEAVRIARGARRQGMIDKAINEVEAKFPMPEIRFSPGVTSEADLERTRNEAQAERERQMRGPLLEAIRKAEVEATILDEADERIRQTGDPRRPVETVYYVSRADYANGNLGTKHAIAEIEAQWAREQAQADLEPEVDHIEDSLTEEERHFEATDLKEPPIERAPAERQEEIDEALAKEAEIEEDREAQYRARQLERFQQEQESGQREIMQSARKELTDLRALLKKHDNSEADSVSQERFRDHLDVGVKEIRKAFKRLEYARKHKRWESAEHNLGQIEAELESILQMADISSEEIQLRADDHVHDILAWLEPMAIDGPLHPDLRFGLNESEFIEPPEQSEEDSKYEAEAEEARVSQLHDTYIAAPWYRPVFQARLRRKREIEDQEMREVRRRANRVERRVSNLGNQVMQDHLFLSWNSKEETSSEEAAQFEQEINENVETIQQAVETLMGLDFKTPQGPIGVDQNAESALVETQRTAEELANKAAESAEWLGAMRHGPGQAVAREIVRDVAWLANLRLQDVSINENTRLNEAQAMVEGEPIEGQFVPGVFKIPYEGLMELLAIGSKLMGGMVEGVSPYEYINHGYMTWIANVQVADGNMETPVMNRWFAEVVPGLMPRYHETIMASKTMFSQYRFQGEAAHRLDHNLKPRSKYGLVDWARTTFEAWRNPIMREKLIEDFIQRMDEKHVSMGSALKPLSEQMRRWSLTTRLVPLEADKDPWKLYTASLGRGQAIVDNLARGPVLDPRGRETGVAPLSDAVDIVGAKKDIFVNLLMDTRVIAKYLNSVPYVTEDGTVEFRNSVGDTVFEPELRRDENGRIISKTMGLYDPDAKHKSLKFGQPFVFALHNYQRTLAQHPEMKKAAKIVYDWWWNFQDYISELAPSMKYKVDQIRRRDPGFYVPLKAVERAIDTINPQRSNPLLPAAKGEVSKEATGGTHQIADVWTSFMDEAYKQMRGALLAQVVDAFVPMMQEKGFGNRLIDLGPSKQEGKTVGERLDERSEAINREYHGQIADEIRAAGFTPTVEQGFDQEPVNIRELLKESIGDEAFVDEVLDREDSLYDKAILAQEENRPNVLPYRTADGELRFMKVVDPALRRWINYQTTPDELNFLAKVAHTAKKLKTFGTTSGRLIFQFYRNPMRDVGTMLINTRTSGTTLELLGEWLTAMYNEVMWSGSKMLAPLGVKERKKTEQQKLYDFVALGGSEELTTDSFYVRDQAKRMNKMGYAKKFKHFADGVMDLLQAPERTTRSVEMMRLAREMKGIDGKLADIEVGKTTFTQEDIVNLALAGKWVSTHFNDKGEFGEKWNRYTAFYNAQIQGPRDTIRALMDSTPEVRAAKIRRALSIYTVVGLANWFRVKDEDWYKELSIQEKGSNWYLPVGEDEVWVFPLPFEIGTAFSSIPVMMVDTLYQDDPATVDWLLSDLGHGAAKAGMLATGMLPDFMPTLGATAVAALTGKKTFWDTPIVSDSMKRLEKHAQYDEYSSYIARWMGRTAKDFGWKEGWSPKMIDYMIESIFGRLGADVATSLGRDAQRLGGLPYTPVIGGVFKEKLAFSKTVQSVYDAYHERQRKFDTKYEYEDQREADVRVVLRDAVRTLSGMNAVLRHIDEDGRRELLKKRLELAKEAMLIHHRGEVLPSQAAAIRAKGKEWAKAKREINAAKDAEREPPKFSPVSQP